MNDLRFIIVNSNMQHAQVLINELKRRVSFEVYQDTKEKNIWGLMQGGKDDLYVYDKCGRLAYYIPFPLSIMSSEESSLVTSAILATYYRSPCGNTCGKNSSTLEDFLNKVSTTETPTETTTEQEVPTTTEFYQDISHSNITEVNEDLFQSNFSSPETTDIKTNSSEVFSDFDYPTYDETLEDYANNETDTNTDNSYFNSLYRFFFNAATTQTPVTENINDTLVSNSTLVEPSEINDIQTFLNQSESDTTNSTEISVEVETQTPKPKTDRCAEADQTVCKDWSKKRLMRAHTCCSQEESTNHPKFCKNFGKKRCKKIRTILKCCIKTALFEATTEAVTTTEEVTTVSVITEVPEEVTTELQEEVTTVEKAKYDITCCKDVEEGKICRVTENPACEPDEYVQEIPLLGRTM